MHALWNFDVHELEGWVHYWPSNKIEAQVHYFVGRHYAQLGKMTLNIHEVFTVTEIPCILCRRSESPKLEENR